MKRKQEVQKSPAMNSKTKQVQGELRGRKSNLGTAGPEALSFPMVKPLSLNFSAFAVRTSLLHQVKIKLINTLYDPAEATHAFQTSDREVETVSKTDRARQLN